MGAPSDRRIRRARRSFLPPRLPRWCCQCYDGGNLVNKARWRGAWEAFPGRDPGHRGRMAGRGARPPKVAAALPSLTEKPNRSEPRMSDPYNLQRFVDAQNPIFDQVRDELRGGRKRTHWMWFVFPQIRGLGISSMAKRYAISSRAEAEAYLRHSVLGARLRECIRLVAETEGRTIEEIFGHPDDLKFRSSMTLFAHATSDNKIFTDAIAKYFSDGFDPLTLERL